MVTFQFGGVEAQQGVAAGGQQVGQAAQQARVVLGGDEAAFLVAGRVDDDQAVGAMARDLAPGAEDVVVPEQGAGLQPIEPVVLPPRGQCAPGHVHVDHLGRACAQRRHRKRAGVGKQVEHAQAGVLRGVALHPAAAFGHVQEQAVVLPAQHMHQVARAVFLHHMRLGHLACHGAGFALLRVAALVHPVQCGAGCQCGPARLQGLVHGGQQGVVGGFKAGEHPHGRVGVQRPAFAAGVQAAPAVEDAAGLGGQRSGGNGGEQGLHGGGAGGHRARSTARTGEASAVLSLSGRAMSS